MTPDDLQIIVDEITAEMAQEHRRGKVANYIPTLASVSPTQFGMTIIDHEGKCYTAGDADTPFSIQSITKVFTLTMALGAVGEKVRLPPFLARRLRLSLGTQEGAHASPRPPSLQPRCRSLPRHVGS